MYTKSEERTVSLSYLFSFGSLLNVTKGPMFAATVDYNALEYETLQSEDYVSGPARKDIMANVLKRLKEGHVSIVHDHVFVETCDRRFY